MGDTSIQFNTPWSMWNAARSVKQQPPVDADERKTSYVLRPEEKTETLQGPSSPAITEVQSPWSPGYIGTGYNPFGEISKINGEKTPNLTDPAFAQTTYTTGDPRLAHDRFNNMWMA